MSMTLKKCMTHYWQ